MKIVEVKATPFKIPYKKPLRFGAAGYDDAAEHVLLEIRTDEDITGIAEAIPRPTIYGESQASIVYAIKRWFMPILMGEEAYNIDKIWNKMDKIVGNTTVKGAIDVALNDIMGKKAGLPLCKLIGGYKDKVEVAWMIGMDSLENMYEEAVEMRKKGIRSFKVKVGKNLKNDIQIIKMIRENMGDEVNIYVDANQAYTVEEAINAIKEMKEYNIKLLEEPVAWWNNKGKKRIANFSPVPLMADESAITPQLVLNEIENGTAGIFSVKIPRTGITRSKFIIQLAEQCGIPCLIGTQSETSIGARAAIHVAASFCNVSYPSEISFFTNLTDEVIKNPLQLEDGFVKVPLENGVGAEVDYYKLNYYKVEINL
ncbi:MAG: L-Ala-D/L-Glu epimerase [Thermoanaerobacteraceae bacterium]|nr:L-Ala-D/L-Glu epimerase [Thermoanaerobacteraceae bacterium]